MSIRIERLMDERNMRAAHIAQELDVGRDMVGRWLKGKGITDHNLERLADLFESTAAWIATGTGPMHPETSAPNGGQALPSVARLLPDDRDDDAEPRARRRAP